jgi:hypothetical protein
VRRVSGVVERAHGGAQRGGCVAGVRVERGGERSREEVGRELRDGGAVVAVGDGGGRDAAAVAQAEGEGGRAVVLGRAAANVGRDAEGGREDRLRD